MSFMQAQFHYGLWLKVESCDGTEFLFADDANIPLELNVVVEEDENPEKFEDIRETVEDYLTCTTPTCFELIEGWGARLSAPGFLDCTEWSVFPTKQEAEEYIAEYYEEDEDED